MMAGLMVFAGLAVRDCGNDGVWKPNYEQNATEGWTNYTDCFKLDPALAGITVTTIMFYCSTPT